MKDLVEYIAKSLVDKPDEVVVNEVRPGNTTIIELKVAQGDMGRVIGREGKVANAIRALARVAGTRQRKRVSVEILD
jgi:uncharacterized protein